MRHDARRSPERPEIVSAGHFIQCAGKDLTGDSIQTVLLYRVGTVLDRGRSGPDVPGVRRPDQSLVQRGAVLSHQRLFRKYCGEQRLLGHGADRDRPVLWIRDLCRRPENVRPERADPAVPGADPDHAVPQHPPDREPDGHHDHRPEFHGDPDAAGELRVLRRLQPGPAGDHRLYGGAVRRHGPRAEHHRELLPEPLLFQPVQHQYLLQ